MREPNNLFFTAIIFALIWVAGTLLRPQLGEYYTWQWYLACLFTGTVAAVAGIFAYKWWNKL